MSFLSPIWNPFSAPWDVKMKKEERTLTNRKKEKKFEKETCMAGDNNSSLSLGGTLLLNDGETINESGFCYR